jgi:hypothetical protein
VDRVCSQGYAPMSFESIDRTAGAPISRPQQKSTLTSDSKIILGLRWP